MIVNDLAPVLDLDGPWQFDTGVQPPGTIVVPGCWEAQGYPKTLDGPVHYRRTFSLPTDWPGQPVVAEFDAASYATEVRCNNQLAGSHLGLWTPFAIDLSPALHPGANTLELAVTKPSHALTGGLYPMRTTLAGFLPDVATTFGGLWQSVRLRVVQFGFDALQVDADPSLRQVRVAAVAVVPRPAAALTVQVEIQLNGATVARHAQPVSPGELFHLLVPLPDAAFWSSTQPALYAVQVYLLADDQVVASASRRVGFRRLVAHGEQLLLNDEPICLRGALSWGWNPDVIAPRYTAEEARAELRTLRTLGFNLVKLCLFVPNQVYYDIADEEGMLVWQEWPLWLPDVNAELCARAPAEYAAYMQLTRSHPSVVVYSLGCELDSSVDRVLLQDLDAVARSAVDHVLFCDNSGSGEAYGGLAEDFADFTDYHTYSDLHYLEPVLDHWHRDWLRLRPWLFGEFCDSDGFRNRQRLLTANDGQVPWWLTADNPASIWRPEMRAVLEYDERMAAAFASETIPNTPIHLHVILNHTNPQPIMRAAVSWQLVAHDGATLAAGRWEILDDLPAGFPCELGHIVLPALPSEDPQAVTLQVQFDAGTLHCRNQWPLWIYSRPRFALDATLLYDPINALDIEWHDYARPAAAKDLLQIDSVGAGSIVVVSTVLDESLRRLLHRGGRVLLLQTGDGPLPSRRLPFWREAIKLPVPHPIWRRFLHAGFVDLQFFGLACDVAFDTQRLTSALPELQAWAPILRRLDARQFTTTDYLFSAVIGGGNGRLVASALRLQGGAGSQPTGLTSNVAGQYLLAELLQLLRSPGETSAGG